MNKKTVDEHETPKVGTRKRRLGEFMEEVQEGMDFFAEFESKTRN